MPEIVVLPHPEICPDGATFEGEKGKSLLDNLLEHGVEVEHACEKSCACTTCHVIVREGGASLAPSSEDEDDLLAPDERAAIDAALARVRSVRDGDDAAAVRAAVGHLNQATAAFAARRMDRGVRRALAGRAVDTLA